MALPGYLITVALYLRGDDLDPELVSRTLGITPSRSQRRGEKQTTSTNKEITTRIGLWAILSESKSRALSDHVAELITRVGTKRDRLLGIPGVQEAYVDVFMAADADADGGGTCEFDLSAEQVAFVAGLGTPIKFTIAVVRE